MTFGSKQLVALLLAVSASAAQAKTEPPKTLPPAYQNVASCRTIVESAERLACYDKAVAALDTAVAANDVYMVDKAQVRESRKSLFGLSLPKLGIFGGGNDGEKSDANEISELESTIQGVSGGSGGWLISIAEGSTWQQMDGVQLGLSPKVGMKVVIKRAAFGSYKMNVRGQPAIKVKRIL
jgi:hypothetical protein